MTSEARVRLLRQTLVVMDRASAVVTHDPAREHDPMVIESLNLAHLVADAVIEEREVSPEEYALLPAAEKWLEVFGSGRFAGGQ